MATTTTSAGTTWQLMHQNDDLASSLILAVSQDDEDGVEDALDLEDLVVWDINLSDEDMKNFMQGVTPSGALDITLWEGYYVTDDPLPNGKKYALFIVSLDNSVYWGPEDKLMTAFKNYAVSYTLSDNGTLDFSSSEGQVSLRLTRDYDLEKGTVGTGKFDGTVGSKRTTGAHTLPPWPKTEDQQSSVKSKASASSRPLTSLAANDTDDGGSGLNWILDWDQTYGGRQILAISTFIGGIAVARSVYRWIRKKCNGEPTQEEGTELTEVLTQDQALALALEGSRVKFTDIDWAGGHDELNENFEKSLNDIIRDQKSDLGSDDPQGEIEKLREQTKTAVQTELEYYALRTTVTDILRQTDSCKAYPGHTKWATDLAKSHAKDRATDKIAEFGYETNRAAFDPLTSGVFYDARRVYFHNNFEASQKALPQANIDLQQATSLREGTEEAIREVQERIDNEDAGDADALLKDEQRKAELEGDLTGQKQDEQEKQKKVDDLQDSVDNDPGRAEDAEGRSEAEKGNWNDSMREHGI